MTEDRIDPVAYYALAISQGLINVTATNGGTLRCVKCARVSVPDVRYELAAIQRNRRDNLAYQIAINAGIAYPPEWLRCECRECGFTWNAFTRDA